MNKGMQATGHEEATIRAFVVRNKQERFLGFIAKPENRKKFTRELPDFSWFDPRVVTSVPWKPDPGLGLWGGRLSAIEKVRRLLHSRGAGESCCVISNNLRIDGQEMDLDSILDDVVTSEWGTILSCIPGKLAYFKGEYESFLLTK